MLRGAAKRADAVLVLCSGTPPEVRCSELTVGRWGFTAAMVTSAAVLAALGGLALGSLPGKDRLS